MSTRMKRSLLGGTLVWAAILFTVVVLIEGVH